MDLSGSSWSSKESYYPFARVSSNGTVVWSRPAVLTGRCSGNFFSNSTTSCQISLGSWSLDDSTLNLIPFKVVSGSPSEGFERAMEKAAHDALATTGLDDVAEFNNNIQPVALKERDFSRSLEILRADRSSLNNIKFREKNQMTKLELNSDTSTISINAELSGTFIAAKEYDCCPGANFEAVTFELKMKSTGTHFSGISAGLSSKEFSASTTTTAKSVPLKGGSTKGSSFPKAIDESRLTSNLVSHVTETIKGLLSVRNTNIINTKEDSDSTNSNVVGSPEHSSVRSSRNLGGLISFDRMFYESSFLFPTKVVTLVGLLAVFVAGPIRIVFCGIILLALLILQLASISAISII